MAQLIILPNTVSSGMCHLITLIRTTHLWPIAFYPLSYTTRPSSMITLLRESSNDETLKECKHFMPTHNNDSEI